ncbi:MAG: RNA polymerase sigma factor [Phycisphaerales bacterium]|nr:RNA polymerase sigma factor [Phycisphaerales bacterium]
MAATTEPDPDQPVIEAIQQGDPDAFRELLRRQDGWVRGIVYSVLGDPHRVDDVTQQVWTTVWERATELRDVGKWRNWLYRLARNAAVDAGRDITRRKRFAETLNAGAVGAGHAPDADDSLTRAEQRQAVREAIDALSPLYREVLTLRHLEGWSYRQIAEVLDVPVDTVETRLVRARRKLRDALQGML